MRPPPLTILTDDIFELEKKDLNDLLAMIPTVLSVPALICLTLDIESRCVEREQQGTFNWGDHQWQMASLADSTPFTC